MPNRVAHIFRNTDLRSQHNGLWNLAKEHWVELKDLSPGEHAIFINTQNDKIKLYSAQGLLSYYRAPKGEKLNLNMIAMLPHCFSARGINWKKAHRMAVEKLLSKVQKQKPGLL